MPTVLYVDDDPAVRMVVRRQLEYHGLQVYTAEGVREAEGAHRADAS
jgi:CheY-like chemotaxis protein